MQKCNSGNVILLIWEALKLGMLLLIRVGRFVYYLITWKLTVIILTNSNYVVTDFVRKGLL